MVCMDCHPKNCLYTRNWTFAEEKAKEYLLPTIRTCLPNSRKYSIYLLQYSSYKLFLSLMGFFSSVSYYSFSRHLNKQYYHIYKTPASSISIDRFYLISKEFFQN